MGETPGTLLGQFSRGYVRHWPSLSAEVQEAALIAAGLTKRQIYWEGRGVETLDALVKAAREGQLIGVFGGFRVFGATQRTIMAAVDAITEAGGIIVDVETVERSDKRGAQMLARALSRIKGERSIAGRADEIGALGGKAKGRRARADRMPEKVARRIWRMESIDTATALSRMWGWSKTKALKEFGPSGRGMGPFKRKK
jgi:hypothetical protein